MARKPRIEVEGGLYHIMTRGNNRQRIFGDDADYQKILRLLAEQKARLPFYLYAYCLMPNHVHLLVERRQDAIGRVMHRLLTTKKMAREQFELFVAAGRNLGHCEEYYPAGERRMLGPEEFVEETKNRVGEVGKGGKLQLKNRLALDLDGLIET